MDEFIAVHIGHMPVSYYEIYRNSNNILLRLFSAITLYYISYAKSM